MATNPKKSKRQAKGQVLPVSPRSGASPKNPHRFKKGESGNPSGSSAKQRMRAAFEKLVTEEAAKGHVDTLLSVAGDRDHPQYAQAVAKLHAVLGLTTDDEKREVIVKTEIALEDRRGSPDQPTIQVRSVSSRSHNQARTGDGAEGVEIEV